MLNPQPEPGPAAEIQPQMARDASDAVASEAAQTPPEPQGPRMDVWLRNAARRARGFMPDDEGYALYLAALEAAEHGPLVEIGTYCGKSTIYLGAAAREKGTYVITVDHHRGSEEHQPGEQYYDPALDDPVTGQVDSLPELRRTLYGAALEDVVIPVVTQSELLARVWQGAVGLVFIDGSHSRWAAQADYESWAPKLAKGGYLAIHDVFEDPAEGGRPPFEVYERALATTSFEEVSATGSLRVLKRVGDRV